ncbi:Asp-tRNA(Asn)/Glu-tRNA(Gln) amidotransferase subunit GatB, partial [Candidatus Uhrbacteria bacterium]|nr:Asp-tRNA(Asn)/Glu-tRNA(Gln) amidotransferase subunit GatB [Candidatus Uhrbacteria bacterium]MBD3283941.1 Asp-tRNA(Asn)/Glu-tRNA(Gln) amidotransferase subunit GatB [Candidatus Uhrbacteria bacterium]
LPALNARALELAMLAGHAMSCELPETAKFDRKNYFYPDLPKGYQISQFDLPVCGKGFLDVHAEDDKAPRKDIRIGITRAHLEEDAAKNQHAPDGTSTLVDYNRGGTPLLEIVTEPDFRHPAEAKAFLQELRALMRTIGVSDADMEKGQMRCDANISLMPLDEDGTFAQDHFNPKVEVKNLNSFKAVERALYYEIDRQTDLYETNTPPVQSTRGWDEHRGVTTEQRTKEGSADYRYFPEPDLPPVDLKEVREAMKSKLPELPQAKRIRFRDEYGFSEGDAAFLIANDGWADYAEHVMSELAGWLGAMEKGKSGGEAMEEQQKKLAKLVGGWLTSKLAGILMTEMERTIKEVNVTAENFAEFIKILHQGEINSSNAQKLLKLMIEKGADPSHLMEEHNLGQNMDESELKEIVQRLIDENPKQVEQFKSGNEKILMWFVGGAMKATEGRANPEKVKALAAELMK